MKSGIIILSLAAVTRKKAVVLGSHRNRSKNTTMAAIRSAISAFPTY
jgi:hypothetical protein